ncbi:fatty-acid-binding protein 1 [Amborella trichopoda]|uniref:Chalcone isomerase domain-containing protein n=1 Tax=Amborella trichopoda TaxID=13333 RepID=U5DFI9_AMBTC|nr:fatty-acid-binding protein 1 [Amborella trichopoda]ERN19183.1 hypothetical protein AMTR_s00061p00179340 [Amborella trichopoda]|eukprot:XP_006857716.1 fatty-acid-binding protein 1 [Amborella trichopoda]
MASLEAKEETVTEPKTGVNFPRALHDGLEMMGVGLRKKNLLGLVPLKIYAFGIYADKERLREIVKAKFESAPSEPKSELYNVAIDADMATVARLVVVYGGLNMGTVRKIFNDNLGASIKKLSQGENNDELLQRVLGEVREDLKLPPGSVIEIAKLPGFVLQTKVMDEVVSRVESEVLCRAYFNMYLGDDPLDPEAKDRFGRSLLSLFNNQ